MAAFADAPMVTDRTAVGLHPDVESMPREPLEALQLRRLQASLCNAWEQVAWQRTRLRAVGLAHPQSSRRRHDPLTRRLPPRTPTRKGETHALRRHPVRGP